MRLVLARIEAAGTPVALIYDRLIFSVVFLPNLQSTYSLAMPGFTPHCPRCDSADTTKVAMQDRYANGVSRVTTAPISTVFSYRCVCGLSFTFEIPHGQPPKSLQTGMRDEVKGAGYQVEGDAFRQ